MAVDFNSIKEIVKKNYKEITGQEFRSNSVIEELFIDPIASMLEPLVSDIVGIKGEVSLDGATDKDEKIVDLIASNLVQERINGGKAEGFVTVYVRERRDLKLPSNVVFSTSKGIGFVVQNDIVYDKSFLVYDENKGAYKTPPFTVYAEKEGGQYSIAANAINSISIDDSNIVDIINHDPFTVVLDKEDNAAFVQRIKDSVSSQSLDSGKGIRYLLGKNFSGLVGDVYTAGFKDPNMKRDRIHLFNTDNKTPKNISDFKGKTPDSNQNSSKCFKSNNRFLQTGSIDDFVDELEADEYSKMYYLDETGYKLSTKNIFQDQFSGSELSSDWRVSETGYELGNVRDKIFARIESNQLILGGHVERNVVLKEEVANQIKNELKAAYPDIDETKLPSISNVPISLNNFSPVALTDIGEFNNIVIKGSFTTDDLGDETRPLYITVCRNTNESEEAYANDGFGFAVMANQVNGAPNVFIVDNNYNDSRMGQIPGTAQMAGDQLINMSNIHNWLQSGKTDIIQGREYFYEMTISLPHSYKGYDYLNDDDKVSTMELRIWGDGDEIKSSRTNAFVMRLGAYIPHNVRPYYFSTDAPSDNIIPLIEGIGYYLGAEYWYNDGTLKSYPKGTQVTKSLIENLQKYGWVNNTLTEIKQVEIQLTSNPLEDTSSLKIPKYELNPLLELGTPTGFGFGVLQTDGYSWRLGEVEVSRITHGYSQLLFKIDVTEVYSEGEPVVQMFGKYKCSGGLENSGFIEKTYGGSVLLYNNTESSFDLSPIHTYSAQEGYVTFDKDVELSADNIISEGNTKYIYVLISPEYRSGQTGVNREESEAEVSYLMVSKEFDAVSTGNAMDVYFSSISDKYNPTSKYEITIPYTSSAPIDLTVGLGINLPIYDVYEVITVDSGGTQISTLEYGEDYTIHHLDDTLIGSVKERPQLIIYSPVAQPYLKLKYKSYDRVQDVQKFFDQSDYRIEDFDILAKHKRIIEVRLELSANVNSQSIIDILKEYIYNNKVVEKIKLINIILNEGATNVPLEDVQLTYSFLNQYGNKETVTVIEDFKIKETDINIPEVIIHPIQ